MANEYIIVQTHTNKKHISETIAETLIKEEVGCMCKSVSNQLKHVLL